MAGPAFFEEFFAAVPWFLPGLVIWGTASALATPWTARALGSRQIVAFFLLISIGFVVLATLTPTEEALGPAPTFTDACDMGRIGVPPMAELLSVNDTSRNVVLFVPLGLALGLLPVSRRSVVLVVMAFALPVLIEAIQLALPALGRGCQTADIVDNGIGLAIGLALGTGARMTAGRIRLRSEADDAA